MGAVTNMDNNHIGYWAYLIHCMGHGRAMNRNELVKTLELVQPALATSGLVPVFGCFMFTEKAITAFSGDALAISAPFTTNLKLAIDGRSLLGLLKNTQAEEVTAKTDKNDVTIKTGKSRFTLPFFSDDDFLFEEPNEKWAASVAITDKLLKGFEICLVTVSRDQSLPALMGLILDIDNESLYSCDGDAVTRCSIKGEKCKGKGSYTVPTSFCESLLKICQSTEVFDGKIELTSNWAKATLANGFKVFGRVVPKQKDFNPEELIETTMVGEMPFVDLPEGFSEALARARVLADFEGKPTVLTVFNGKLDMLTKSSLGEVDDSMPFKGHDDVEAMVHASLIQRSLAICDQMSIRENCTAYRRSDDVLQVVSNVGE